MSRIGLGGARIALLALAMTLVVLPPAGAGVDDPHTCVEGEWRWTGALSDEWDEEANWVCEDGSETPPVNGYPNGPDHIATIGADTEHAPIDILIPVSDPFDGTGPYIAITIGQLHFTGTQAFRLTGGLLAFAGDEPTITNDTPVEQLLDLTVFNDAGGLLITGSGDVLIAELAGAFLVLYIEEPGTTLRINILDGFIAAHVGPGSLVVTEALNQSTGGAFVSANQAPGVARIEARGDAGAIWHLVGSTELAPGGAGEIAELNPALCGFFLGGDSLPGCGLGPDLDAAAFAGCEEECPLDVIPATLLGSGATYEVHVRRLLDADDPFDGADLINAGGPVFLETLDLGDLGCEVPVMDEEMPITCEDLEPVPGAAALDITVQDDLSDDFLYPIVLSHPAFFYGDGSDVSGFAGAAAVDPCIDHAAPYGICGEFDGYPDGHVFSGGGPGREQLKIHYLTGPELDELMGDGEEEAPMRRTAMAGSEWASQLSGLPLDDDVVIAVALEVIEAPPVVNPPPPPPPPPGPPLPPAQEPLEPTRLGGAERIETAVIGSQEAFDDGAAGAVVLATADNPADAVAGTPFAVANDAPILLTDPEQLTPIVAEEIQRILGAGKTVYVMGLADAIADGVLAEIEALGYAVERVGGVNRFATAVEVADRLLGGGFAQPDGEALLADGHGFIAATLSGPAAAATGGVVLLTAGEDMAPETAAWLGDHPAVETTAIGAEAEAAAPKSDAIDGDTPPELSVAVAEAFFDTPDAIGVATYAAFPDPLTGGTHVALLGGPLLLSDRDELPSVIADYVAAIGPGLDELFVYGGTAALSDAVVDALSEASTTG